MCSLCWRLVRQRCQYLSYKPTQTKKYLNPKSPSNMCSNERINHLPLLSLQRSQWCVFRFSSGSNLYQAAIILPITQYGSGSRGANLIRIHLDPDPKHWIEQLILWAVSTVLSPSRCRSTAWCLWAAATPTFTSTLAGPASGTTYSGTWNKKINKNNFLHSYSIEKQLRVAQIEENTKVPDKFRFQFFTEMQWYALDKYVYALRARSHLQLMICPTRTEIFEGSENTKLFENCTHEENKWAHIRTEQTSKRK